MAAVQTALTLLGNAAAQISLEHHKALMKHLNKDLRPLAGACYPKRGQWLFGEDFDLKTKNMADSVKALKPLAPKRKQVFRDDSGPTKKRHGPRVVVETGPTLSHFSMQEALVFQHPGGALHRGQRPARKQGSVPEKK